jgi:hypothetical protein
MVIFATKIPLRRTLQVAATPDRKEQTGAELNRMYRKTSVDNGELSSEDIQSTGKNCQVSGFGIALSTDRPG